MGHCTVPDYWQNYSQFFSNVNLHPHSNSFSSLLLNAAPLPSGENHEVTELTWENGQISMHGLNTPRVENKPLSPATWDQPRAGGTLESIVNQAANCHPQNTNKLLPLFEQNGAAAKPKTDVALVPALALDKYQVRDGGARAGCGTMSDSGTCGAGRESQHVMRDSLGRTSMENTISADHSISHTNSHPTNKKTDDMEGKKKLGVGQSVSTKRSRAAASHNQSERKRRDKINQRIKTLQKMVPNSSKTDKASMLDEVIEYLKQLQTQANTMRKTSFMMWPLLQQQLQISMMCMGMGPMDMNTINYAAPVATVPPVNPPAAASMHTSWNNPADRFPPAPPAGQAMPDSLAAPLGCQYQPMTMDDYSRLVAMHQQMQHPPA